MYQRRLPPGFGNQSASNSSPEKPRVKPLKRPSQGRAKFTVQAIYDAFVRIWRKQGWTGITTRAVALETGVSVGTLYEYFPNKHALLSGYVRHYMDVLLETIEQQVVQAAGLTWQERVHRLVRLTCGIDVPELPYFDAEMLMLECQIAEPKHHRRVYEEMTAKWIKVCEACVDLPHLPDAATARTLYLCAWGGRRYQLLVQPHDIEATVWVAEVERLCRLALDSTR